MAETGPRKPRLLPDDPTAAGAADLIEEQRRRATPGERALSLDPAESVLMAAATIAILGIGVLLRQ